eukprot:2628822-Alexandrium_andersonii.AAC.1
MPGVGRRRPGAGHGPAWVARPARERPQAPCQRAARALPWRRARRRCQGSVPCWVSASGDV